MKIFRITLFLLLIVATAGCRQDDLRGKTAEERIAILDKEIHKHNNRADLYARRAEAFLELGRVNDAINDLSRATNLDSKNSDYFLMLGDAYFRNGNADKSYESLTRALELKPDSKEITLKLGEISFYSRDFDRAMEHLSQVTAVDPDNRTALFMKSFIYTETGDTVNAITLLNKICDLYPDYTPAFEQLANIYAAHHSPLAIEYLNTVLRMEPDNINARYTLAMIYQESGQMEQAEAIYKEMLDIDANAVDAWHNRAYIQLFHYGDYELAIDYFTQALTCDSTHVASLVNRGIAYELLGKKEKARDDYQHAAKLQADYKPALDGLQRTR